ncbi:Fanconi anemia group A protein-like isoform X3 [Acropora palmata]|uniref:Fanconi anemia group A protein-like isoform X3 n=1 Tax=Acropora palmata TaxID=6131 RepID=UPI003DA12B4E
MELERKIKAKRSRGDYYENKEEEDSVQIKFKRLLERNVASQGPRVLETTEELKRKVLKLVEDNLSFEGMLRESEDTYTVQYGSLQKVQNLDEFSTLSSSVESIFEFLKCQATQASVPLDLLAGEMLASRLLSLLSSSCDPLLTFKQLDSVLFIVKVIKHMLIQQCFNRVYFTKHLTKKGSCIPLEVIWLLHKDCIITFDTYLACCLQHNGTVRTMTSGLVALSSCIVNRDKQERILSVLVGRMVMFPFLENKVKESPNNKLEQISQEILDAVVESSDFDECGKNAAEHPSKKDDEDSICLLEIIRRLNDVQWTVIKKFFSRQLNLFFKMKSANDIYCVFSNQKKLKFASLSKRRKTVFEQFLLVFEPSTVMEYIKNALFKDEVNLDGILSFVATFAVLVNEALPMIEDFVNELLNRSLNTFDSRSLYVAFLLVRQLSLEGGHVFQPYITWFQGCFGDQGNMKLTNRKTVQFFMKCLSDLVPYEPAEYLKVHAIKSPQVPTKLRELVTDYISLVKTRLMDLKEPLELYAGQSEQEKQLKQASADVNKVLESFEKTGKVPNSVMEASIFRKPYFIGRFLPALLTPRKIPDEADSRSQLIDVLSKGGKIPKNMLITYQSACEKIVIEQIEVSSSDDEGNLSGMEKLVISLEKFTQLVSDSFKSIEPCKEPGKISSQLSIISAAIQSFVKTPNDVPIVNQVVEIDLSRLDKNCGAESDSSKSVETLLQAFYKTWEKVTTCTPDLVGHAKRFQWIADFVSMIVSTPSLHQSLYCQLWDKLCCKGESLMREETRALAVFLCHLCTNKITLIPVLMKGTDSLHGTKLTDTVFTICSFVDVLCQYVPLTTKQWVEFYLRFSSSFLENAHEVFGTNVTEMKSRVGRHTAYLSPTMLKKTFYLLHRLNVTGEACLFKPRIEPDVIGAAKNLVSKQICQLWKGKQETLTFSEWCEWELSISITDDFLPDTDRRIYHQYRVLDHYLPLGSQEGGCDGSARKACSVIFGVLLSRCSKQRQEQNGSWNDMISLLQELVPMLRQSTTCEAEFESVATEPWLLDQFHRRIATIQSEIGKSESKTSLNIELLQASIVVSFMKLAMRLPSYLLFSDTSDGDPHIHAVKRVAVFINSYLRPYISERCCLEFDITHYIFKALLAYTHRPTDNSRTMASSQLLSQCFSDCPLLLVSVQHYWKQLKVLTAVQYDVTHSRLKDAELLSNWKNRVEGSESVSLRELESSDVCVVAALIALSLRKTEKTILELFRKDIQVHKDFIEKLAVCLFDCVVAEFSQMLIHGQEMREDSLLLDFAWKLTRYFPCTLLVFKQDGCFEQKESLQRLRAKLLKDQPLRLYSAVFFSLFSNMPKDSLKETIVIDGFLELTLRMYSSFVYLRKECLEGVINKTAVCSPLHLEFCRQVSVFVRDCVLTSPAEILANLSQDVILSCTSELRQFLQSRIPRFQKRQQGRDRMGERT